MCSGIALGYPGEHRRRGAVVSVLVMRAGVFRCCYLRLESIWRVLQADMQAAILSWTRARFWEGADVHGLFGWRLPDQWSTSWFEEPFDLLVLEREFTYVPTSIANVPVLQGPATDPFAWITGSVARRVPAAVSTLGAL
jgi:hypothetical protein